MRMSFFDESWTRPPSRGLGAVPGPVRKLGLVLESPFKDEKGAPCRFWGDSPHLLKDGSFRMYAGTLDPAGVRMAASKDGLHWEFPSDRLQPIDGVEGTPFRPCAVALEDGSWRLYLWVHGKRGKQDFSAFRVAESADGLSWKVKGDPVLYHPNTLGYDLALPRAPEKVREFLERKGALSNDSTTVRRDPRTGRFELHTAMLLPNPPDSPRHVADDNIARFLRVVARRTSDDGLRWSAPEMLFSPDESDPPTRQYYGFDVWLRDDWRVGFLQSYLCADKTIDTEIVFSRDGARWHRPTRGKAFIPRGGEGEQDASLLVAHAPPVRTADGRLALYYSGWPNKHGARDGRGASRPGIMAAELDEGRLVGLAAGKEPGLLVTPPYWMSGTKLTIDAAIHGELRARLTDVFGREMAGHGFKDAAPLHGDSHGHALAWKGGSGAGFQYDMVRLELAFDRGVVYGVDVVG